MVEEVSQIDTSHIDSLVKLKKQEEAVEGLIDKARANKDKVSEVIYQRVIRDYETRQRGLEAQAQPLREKARGEFLKLRAVHERLEAALEKARLDKQELEFRHEVGELTQEQFDQLRKASDEVFSACQRDFDDGAALRKRFLEVVAEPVAEAPKEVAPVPEAAPVPHDAPPEGGETMFVTRDDLADITSDFGTVAVPGARLVQEIDGRAGSTHALGAITTIGRTPDNQIQIDRAEVSRRHARIALTEAGFTVTDLNSGNGTFVNGERIAERALTNGDKLQIGNTHFVFLHVG